MKKPTLCIIGGGASGLAAAYFAAKNNLAVTVIERNEKAGRKLAITGKGRCNLTSANEGPAFLEQIVHGKQFLRSALAGFGPSDTVAWFSSMGLSTHVERGERVFPDCEDAKQVAQTIKNECVRLGVRFQFQTTVEKLLLDNGRVTGVVTDRGTLPADAVLLATGGKSYPVTGSDGTGYLLAKQAGHTIVPPRPALVPLVCHGSDCPDMMGLSLKNVRLTVKKDGVKKPVFEKQGDLLFTHFGLSGPLALSASSFLTPEEHYQMQLDWKPALSEEQLDNRLLREIAAAPAREIFSLLHTLLPSSAVPVFLRRWMLPADLRSDRLRRENRRVLMNLLKHFMLDYAGLRPMAEGIITAGGVSLKEVNPKTMASKCCARLFLAGELLDCDALTGGYNLQIAFSTAFAAANGASQTD